MSLYGTKVKIDGVPCGLIMRGIANGSYQVVFERGHAALEQIEAINWAQPVIEGSCPLPAGYGFEVDNIQYNSSTRCYTVTLQVAEQYLGDVTGFQAQVDELAETVSAQEKEIASLRDQLAEADEAAIELYEALAAATAEAPETPPEEAPEEEPAEQEEDVE